MFSRIFLLETTHATMKHSSYLASKQQYVEWRVEEWINSGRVRKKLDDKIDCAFCLDI